MQDKYFSRLRGYLSPSLNPMLRDVAGEEEVAILFSMTFSLQEKP